MEDVIEKIVASAMQEVEKFSAGDRSYLLMEASYRLRDEAYRVTDLNEFLPDE